RRAGPRYIRRRSPTGMEGYPPTRGWLRTCLEATATVQPRPSFPRTGRPAPSRTACAGRRSRRAPAGHRRPCRRRPGTGTAPRRRPKARLATGRGERTRPPRPRGRRGPPRSSAAGCPGAVLRAHSVRCAACWKPPSSAPPRVGISSHPTPRPSAGPREFFAPSGLISQRNDVFRKPLVAAVHEVVLHPLGEAARIGDEANRFGHFANVHRGRATTHAEVVDPELVGFLRERADLVPVRVQRVERGGEGAAVRGRNGGSTVGEVEERRLFRRRPVRDR